MGWAILGIWSLTTASAAALHWRRRVGLLELFAASVPRRGRRSS